MTKPLDLGAPNTIIAAQTAINAAIDQASKPEGKAGEQLITITISSNAAKELVGTVTDKLLEKGPEALGQLLGQVKIHAPELIPVAGEAVKTLVGAFSEAMGKQATSAATVASSALSAAVGQAVDNTRKRVDDAKNKAVDTATAPFRFAAGVARFGIDVLTGGK